MFLQLVSNATMRYSQFLKEWTLRTKQQPFERKGQALMNVLRTFDESAYDIITVEEKDKDCFYRENIIPTTLEFLFHRWNR